MTNTVNLSNSTITNSLNVCNSTIDNIFGNDEKTDIYICEQWQTKKPIKVSEDLIISFKEDLLSSEEIKEKIFEAIMASHPEKVIKLGLEPNNLVLRKILPSIEIKI